jgi:hypothetical protein
MAHDVRQNKLTIPEKRPWLSSTVAFEGSGEAKAIARMAQRHIASRVRRDMTCQEACQEARGGMGAREERGEEVAGWVSVARGELSGEKRRLGGHFIPEMSTL